MIGEHAHARALRERREAREFLRADDLVADHHVGHAAVHQRLGLRHLLAAHADRAALHLDQRDLRALVALRMGPDANVAAGERAIQGVEVVLEGVEIEQQGGRVDFVERHAGAGGRGQGHGISCGSIVHGGR